ncbi:hypothetical protein FISHEDRAFT_74087 [Fistulina hepatica ATCC 64428]|uniref:AAA-ATPase-like domain-containing protein n=1 Tax=Fistulina hepatica ATCC 64428 TaxID=1128425 RepID=A0A0D7AAG5_9AGAR|nr:hypothetical protein FISHEDRAFT_74087 [Fistulina hepatica ATCC 64428]
MESLQHHPTFLDAVVQLGVVMDRGVWATHALCKLARCLPEPSMYKLFSFACVSGTVFVDKTAVIDFLYERFQQSKLPLVRRPAGFGKTVFLSTVARYHDYNGPALTKCLLGQTACWTPNAPQPNQHLVLYFDFSQVSVGPTFKDDFERYLLQMVLSFVDTYDDVLNISADIKSTFDEFDILLHILSLVAYRHHTVFLAVDNYNAIQLKAWSIDDADELDGEFAQMVDETIDRAFCQSVEGALLSVIKDGLIVGTSDCGYADPIGVFSGMGYDMTYKAPLRGTFGFTEEEVDELAKLFCQASDFVEEVRRGKKVRRFNGICTARREKRVLGYDPRTRGWCDEDDEMMEADGINFEEEDNKEASENSDDESSDDETEADNISGVCVYSMTDVLNLLRERIIVTKEAEL